jgi:hydroxyethylthiazole kinase-like uncharacterized protein yjeF
MKLYRAADMRAADAAAAEAGVPTQLLMEAAGRAVAESALRNFPASRRPLVLCGKGNNGGDGYVTARYLHLAGLEVTLLELTGDRPPGDAASARAACLAHLPSQPLDAEKLEPALADCDLVIDALFGSGLTRPLTGELERVVALVNAGRLPVLAIDVPSGVDSDRPAPTGPCIRATRTVQLAGPKLASVFDPARSAFGEQEVAAIGIPEAILEVTSSVRLLTADAGRGIPERARDAHKYQVGTVLVLAGSPRYLGAAELACRGAYRAGAGLVTLAAAARLPSSWPEIVFSELDWGSDPLASLAAIEERRSGAVVAGPGLDERALDHLPALLENRPVPWVLDAGALTPSPELRSAVRAHGRCVLTPHAGEAARLLGCAASEVTSDPLGAAATLAREWGATCVLKGGSTVVAARDGSLSVSTQGHPGMATGGTGDVLAGVTGAFLAAGGEQSMRVEAAVAVHGLAGALAGSESGIGMVASDLLERLPLALRQLSA